GRTLASVGLTVQFWDVATGREVAALKPHSRGAVYAAFSPDGEFLATVGDEDGFRDVSVWDVTRIIGPPVTGGGPRAVWPKASPNWIPTRRSRVGRSILVERPLRVRSETSAG